MRARVTYVHDAEGRFDLDQVSLKHGSRPDSLSVNNLHAAREVKVTVGLDELPQELQQVLKQSYELHIRWVAELPFTAVAPFASRISPGLHVSYTPSDQKRAGDQFLCPLLRKAFSDDLKCSIPEVSFVDSPVTSTRSLHYYQLVPSCENFVTYIQKNICSPNDACDVYASDLYSADYVDVNYDGVSSSLSIIGYWSQSSQKDGWYEAITQEANARVEVGILAGQQPLGLEELRVGGFLAVLGEDKELKPTLFSFPSRHHPLPPSSVYKAAFSVPSGLHPTLKLSMPRDALTPPRTASKGVCSLHTFITLPSTVFADKYQLSTTDPLFLQSHNLVALRSIAGETDLEVPDWVTERWGSDLLLELATPQPDDSNDAPGEWEITVPLHLRYLHPAASGYRNISIPWPIVFWACAAGEDGVKLEENPFDRVDLGWDELFTPQTMFYQLHPSPEESKNVGDLNSQAKLVEKIQVPVLRIGDGAAGTSHARNVELGTVLVIVAGFAWVLWKLGIVARAYGVGGNGGTVARAGKVKGT